jgi:hypothetical protein
MFNQHIIELLTLTVAHLHGWKLAHNTEVRKRWSFRFSKIEIVFPTHKMLGPSGTITGGGARSTHVAETQTCFSCRTQQDKVQPFCSFV